MAKNGCMAGLLSAIVPDLRTTGWNRAKWAVAPIAASGLLSFPLGWLLSNGKLTTSTAWIWIGTFCIASPIFMLITRLIIWVLIVNPMDQRFQVERREKKRAKRRRPVNTFLPSTARFTPKDFEHEVAWVLETVHNLQSQVVGSAGDGGIDINLFDRTGTRVAIVQVKMYKGTVSPSALRDLDSCRRRSGVARAYLVTTGKFSSKTRQDAQEMRIDLVDGEEYAILKHQAEVKAASKSRY